MTNEEILNALKGGLIVSCQAQETEPLYNTGIMPKMARAAKEGGAVGIRANTPDDVAAIKKEVALPVIGLHKVVYPDSEIYITPTIKEIDGLVKAGADIIALDATDRIRPDGITLKQLFSAAKEKYPATLFMADISTYDEGVTASELGFDLISTTLSGYTASTKGRELPDFELMRRLVEDLKTPIVAEGGIWEPCELARAFSYRVWTAVVGTAITRPRDITKRFVKAIEGHSKEKLVSQLIAMGLKPTDTLLMHTSLRAVGKINGGADTLIDALQQVLSDGMLVIPTHTWNTVGIESPVFDVNETPSCVGTLPNIFRKRSGVVRTLHPTHSLGIWGKDAEEFAKGEEKLDTPCNPKSCYGKLIDKNAYILLTGVDFGRNTMIHCIEEIAEVPYRLKTELHPLVVRDTNGNETAVPSHRHQNANSDLYVKLEPVMLYHNILKKFKLGDADCLLMKAQDLKNVVVALTEIDKNILGNSLPIPFDWYANMKF